MDSLDTCVKLEMTKTGAVPGQMGLATSIFLTTTHYLLLIGAPSYFWESCFTVLRSLRRCVLTSHDHANGSFTTLGIAHVPCHTCIPIYATTTNLFCVIPMEYSMISHQFTVEFTVLYRL